MKVNAIEFDLDRAFCEAGDKCASQDPQHYFMFRHTLVPDPSTEQLEEEGWILPGDTIVRRARSTLGLSRKTTVRTWNPWAEQEGGGGSNGAEKRPGEVENGDAKQDVSEERDLPSGKDTDGVGNRVDWREREFEGIAISQDVSTAADTPTSSGGGVGSTSPTSFLSKNRTDFSLRPRSVSIGIRTSVPGLQHPLVSPPRQVGEKEEQQQAAPSRASSRGEEEEEAGMWKPETAKPQQRTKPPPAVLLRTRSAFIGGRNAMDEQRQQTLIQSRAAWKEGDPIL